MKKKDSPKSGRCHLHSLDDESNWHASLDEHHVLPQFAGGKHLPTIMICQNCHTNLHKMALYLTAKSRQGMGKMEDPEGIRFFPDPAMRAKARPYVNAIIRALLYAKENRLDDVLVPITIKVPRHYREKFHTLKIDAGFSNLEKFVTAVLVTYARAKGVNLSTNLDFEGTPDSH